MYSKDGCVPFQWVLLQIIAEYLLQPLGLPAYLPNMKSDAVQNFLSKNQYYINLQRLVKVLIKIVFIY